MTTESEKAAQFTMCYQMFSYYEKVQVGNDQEKAQSEKDSHSKKKKKKKKRGGAGKTKLTIRYLGHEYI